MLKQKTNIRKTRAGNVIKEVKEIYLRRDIYCGIVNCKFCSKNIEAVQTVSRNNKVEGVFKLDPLSCEQRSNLGDSSAHILIPSLEVVDSQIDFLEDRRIQNVVIMQTAIDRYKNSNRQQHQRLLHLLSVDEKRFYQFHNEFHADIFVQKAADESIQDRNNRCMTSSNVWYTNHVKNHLANDNIKIVVLTLTEKEAAKLRTNSNLTAYSIKDYVNSFVDFDDIFDKLNVEALNIAENDGGETAVISENTAEKFSFPSYLSTIQINSGLAAGTLFKGVYHANSDNFKEGSVYFQDITVKIDEKIVDNIFISGLMQINRAFDQDIVVVELLPKSEWKCVASKIEYDSVDKNSIEIETDDSIKKDTIPSGKIVAIIKRNWKHYCGTLQISKVNPGGNNHLFKPLNRKIPFISIETRRAAELADKRICVAVDSWPKHFRYPNGHYLMTLGDLGDKNVETETILMEEAIRFQPFSKLVLDCLPNLENPEDYSPDIFLGKQTFRRDLRHLNICSIDPPGCTDIDDALHCRLVLASESGHTVDFYEVGVHIADVTQFVIPGTALDEEAYSRGTTVYLTDRRIDMIPSLLSSNLCSLRENVDRLAFSVLWYFDTDGNLLADKAPEFCKSVIKSRRALTYNEAQAVLDDFNDDSELANNLRMLHFISKKLRDIRINRGAIILASSEVRFEMDESNEPLELQKKELLDANRLVEDFMLLANTTVAAQLYKCFPLCAVLRRHPPPTKGSFKPICDLLKEKFNLTDSRLTPIADDLNSLISLSKNLSSDKYVETLLKILSTRCLKQAVYFCSGTCSESEFNHYGLAENIYTHFTSPIRRYPDILVHRLLSAALGITSESSIVLTTMKPDQLQAMCDHLNKKNRSARLASWSSLKLHTCLFVKNSPNGVLEEGAYVLQLTENAIKVFIPRFSKEGTIYLDDKMNRLKEQIDISLKPQIVLNETQSCMSFVGLKTKITKLQRVVIQMAVRQTEACHMDSLIFLLVKPEIPGISVPSILN